MKRRGTRIVTVLIPLPIEYNPDRAGKRKRIEQSKFMMTAEEIARKFQGGGSIWRPKERDALKGFWWDRGYIEWDTPALIDFDIPDTPANRRWVMKYAETVLRKRFKQKAIYVRFVPGIDTFLSA
jgi:hypothetical protein